MKIIVDILEQDYVYIAKKHCLPSCDDRTLRKNFYEMVAKGTPLDEIRGEIKEYADRSTDSLYGDGLRHVLDIIDES